MPDTDGDSRSPRSLAWAASKEARRLEKEGSYGKAAEIRIREGSLRERAKDDRNAAYAYSNAARSLTLLGHWRRAAGFRLLAARLFEFAGREFSFEVARNYEEAAKLEERSGDTFASLEFNVRSADLYLKIDRFADAAYRFVFAARSASRAGMPSASLYARNAETLFNQVEEKPVAAVARILEEILYARA
jgi:hypothetical protein